MKSLLLHHGRRQGILMSSRPLLFSTNFSHLYCSGSSGGILHEMGEKARSTAEEFTRKAEEKKETIKESAEEALETAKDAALRDAQADHKEKFKEKVEKGNYNKIGRD